MATNGRSFSWYSILLTCFTVLLSTKQTTWWVRRLLFLSFNQSINHNHSIIHPLVIYFFFWQACWKSFHSFIHLDRSLLFFSKHSCNGLWSQGAETLVVDDGSGMFRKRGKKERRDGKWVGPTMIKTNFQTPTFREGSFSPLVHNSMEHPPTEMSLWAPSTIDWKVRENIPFWHPVNRQTNKKRHWGANFSGRSHLSQSGRVLCL